MLALGNFAPRRAVKAFVGLATGWLLTCLAACAVFAQSEPAPSFEAAGVLFVDRPVPLAPGIVLSIFGNNLGPSTGCASDHDEMGIYPKELCRTQVLVGGIPSELLWVQAGQINFKVPKETPIHGTADLVVVYQVRSSKAVAMPLGVESATLSLDGPARVGMPVWLKLKAPYNRDSGIRYPFMIFPASFGCNEVEVRRDGMLLRRIADVGKQAVGGIVMSGNPCGWLGFRSEPHFKDRFPLHLQYRFDQPGTYEVQLSERRPFSDAAGSVAIPWTKIEILPADAGARKQWLADKIAHAPSDAADLLADFLPSILGNPDEETLLALRPYLYHPDRLVREYAKYGLTYWPADQVGPKIWEWIRAQGPSDATVDFFLHLKDFSAPHAAELAELSIPYLQLNSAVLVYGALRVLSAIVLPADSGASPDVRARAGDAMIRAAEHIIQIDPENVNEFVADVGQLRDERAHDLLWDLANRRVGHGQALIALTWLKSLPDLSKLAQLTLQPASRLERGYEFASLPYALHNAFGDAAIPYLDSMLERSEFTWVRTNSARELMLASRSEGFAFVADAISNGRAYRQEMIQFVRDQFPELRQADDAALLKFVQARARPRSEKRRPTDHGIGHAIQECHHEKA